MDGSSSTGVGTTVEVMVSCIDELGNILVSVVGITVFVTSVARSSTPTFVSLGATGAVATSPEF